MSSPTVYQSQKTRTTIYFQNLPRLNGCEMDGLDAWLRLLLCCRFVFNRRRLRGSGWGGCRRKGFGRTGCCKHHAHKRCEVLCSAWARARLYCSRRLISRCRPVACSIVGVPSTWLSFPFGASTSCYRAVLLTMCLRATC